MTLLDKADNESGGDEDVANADADCCNVFSLDINGSSGDPNIMGEVLILSGGAEAADITEESTQHTWTK